MSPQRQRMTAAERREQLITVAREVFAEEGVQGVSVEQLASRALVTKPVIYEHFGGKEGLYAVVIDRSMRELADAVTEFLGDCDGERELLEQAVWGLLTFIETQPAAFRVLSRDAPSWHTTGSLASLMSEVARAVETALTPMFERHAIDPTPVPIYTQMLVGQIALCGDWWLERGTEFSKEQVAQHIVNLAWNGLRGLSHRPTLKYRGHLQARDESRLVDQAAAQEKVAEAV